MNACEPVGTIRALWRFPVKSMLGEQLDAADLGEGDIVFCLPPEQGRPPRPGLPSHGRSRFWARSPRPSRRPRFATLCARPARHPQRARPESRARELHDAHTGSE
jgi:hypothetical protein